MALVSVVASQSRLFRTVAELNARESNEEEELLPKRESSSSSCDSCAFSSATVRKSLACKATPVAQ